MSLIHRYQNNGYNIVLDINSGCIHVVDEVTYEVLPYMEEGLDTAAIVGKLGDQFSEEDITQATTAGIAPSTFTYSTDWRCILASD